MSAEDAPQRGLVGLWLLGQPGGWEKWKKKSQYEEEGQPEDLYGFPLELEARSMSAEVPPTNDSNVYEGAIGIGM